MDILYILEKCIWFGCGALGFAILFNVPVRTLWIIWILGALAGFIKLFAVHLGLNVILGTLLGATAIGLLSIWAAYNKNAPPLVFSIPASIPMIPGVFVYKMILGIMVLAGNSEAENYMQTLAQTVNYASKVWFILVCISVGVSLPILIIKRTSKITSRLQRE